MTTQDLAQVYIRTNLHRETYIAALNGALAARGAKKQFAEKAGITAQYLSNLLNPEKDRYLSSELAQKIAENAPIPSTERGELLHHLLMSNPRNYFVETKDVVPLSRREAQETLRNVADAQFITYLKRSPEVAKQASRLALKLGTWAMLRIDPRQMPYIYVEMATHLHNTASSLNMPISAFWCATSMQDIATNEYLWLDSPYESERFNKVINSWRMLSVTYHNFGLADKALDAVETAKQLLRTHGTPDMVEHWTPHLVMEELNAYALTNRFAISAAESAAERGMNSLGFGFEAQKIRDLIGSLIQRNLVETYIQHGSKKSLRQAEQRVYHVFTPDHLQNFSALTHTLHLRTGANLARKIGDNLGYRDWIGRARRLATDAGLVHQRAEIDYETRKYQI